ncbi:alveolin domain containing intermediate filament IMC12 [Besnoitia besnoiti]|uniref:Alveolin domain containing intermediate filament IMC12 n=1 Tax=Besnoitia besnoiti TaxID=94643 RepID=A0A2A9MQ88_BESBE|nr:alveolin domain containing intermediate filament IMC12 [Besnoitia besnoiti]PFH38140.1 alveolin domain containing intermediate filament IMC12 [Besnoitia besnoiti]
MAAAECVVPSSMLAMPATEHGLENLSGAANMVPPARGTQVVDVPFVHYRQTLTVKEVKVPVEVTKVSVKKVEVPGVHEVPIIKPREVSVHQVVRRNVPDPVDVFTVQTYNMPRIQPKYYDVEVPIYVPRYVEVPVPSHFVTLQKEELPAVVPVGPPLQSLHSAPVLENDQVYSLAPSAANECAAATVSAGFAEEQFSVHRQGSGSSDYGYTEAMNNEGLKAELTLTGSPSAYNDAAAATVLIEATTETQTLPPSSQPTPGLAAFCCSPSVDVAEEAGSIGCSSRLLCRVNDEEAAPSEASEAVNERAADDAPEVAHDPSDAVGDASDAADDASDATA